jgi:site-specific recombinase XerD
MNRLRVCSVRRRLLVAPASPLGDLLVDTHLVFVAGRVRPNTLRAVAHDLKTFFTVIDKDPTAVCPADVFEFLADQRGDRTVVRLADRESGLSARTIARRRAGLRRVTCHELRHSCPTRLREAGMAIEAFRAQAGHRSIDRPASTCTSATTGSLMSTAGPPISSLPDPRR